MRVVSSLADIDFGVGRVYRAGRNLIIESSADSTLATTVTITHGDALVSLGALITSPSAWLFLLRLPFAIFAGGSSGKAHSSASEWDERRKHTGLNKPW
jgi:hypothetical protein